MSSQCQDGNIGLTMVATILKDLARHIDFQIFEKYKGPTDTTNIDAFLLSPFEHNCTEAAMKELCLGHVAAGRMAMQHSFETSHGFSFCNDDSNVRSLELSNTAFALTDNTGIWAPVQVAGLV